MLFNDLCSVLVRYSKLALDFLRNDILFEEGLESLRHFPVKNFDSSSQDILSVLERLEGLQLDSN